MERKDLFTPYRKDLPETLDADCLLDHWYRFMEDAPFVREACIKDYAEAGLDWRKVALEMVFSHQAAWLGRMDEAHANLEEALPKVLELLETEADLPRVEGVTYFYHGLGNGAGWAREIDSRPAMLFGIEKIAELGWQKRARIESLVAHEYVHLAHASLRGMTPTAFDELTTANPLFRLYAEGLATHAENLLQGRRETAKQWFFECMEKIGALKSHFEQSFQAGDTHKFYGDWHQVEGIEDAGYFLGFLFVEGMLDKMTFAELARLDTHLLEKEILSFLKAA